MLEIIVHNIIFWTLYTYVCMIPYKLLQLAIERSGDEE